MIETILKYFLPNSEDLNPINVSVHIDTFDHPFVEKDAKSCNQCHLSPSKSYRVGCNEEILKVDNKGKTISVVRFEEYLKQFKKCTTERCDLIMADSGVDHEKIVFCDLCCYEEKYVEPNTGIYQNGKRAKARQQMSNTIEFLLKEEMTAVSVLTYAHKVCLFAWRDYDVPDTYVQASRGDARANMQVFSGVVSNMTPQTTTHHEIMNHDFVFMQIKYPSTYIW